MADLRCSHCGGPLTARSGQHVVLPTVTLTLDESGRYESRSEADDAWCGPCLAEWDARMGASPDGPNAVG